MDGEVETDGRSRNIIYKWTENGQSKIIQGRERESKIDGGTACVWLGKSH